MREFRNVATTFMLTSLTLVGHLEFVGRIFDHDLQMPDEFPNVVSVKLVFDALITHLDLREAASKQYN